MDYDDCYSAPILQLTPPVYLMKSQIKCYLCGNDTDVFALAASGFQEVINQLIVLGNSFFTRLH